MEGQLKNNNQKRRLITAFFLDKVLKFLYNNKKFLEVDILDKVWFRKNPDGVHRISEEQQRAIAVGAILTENNGEFCDSLYPNTDYSIEEEMEMLNSWWGIASREEALDTLNWLLQGGHRVEYNTLTPMNVTAWDMGRMVNVSRWCYKVGYISENEAWQYILAAEKESRLCYANWAEFGTAYVVGRAIWSQTDADAQAEWFDIVDMLVNDKNSPWNIFPLRGL